MREIVIIYLLLLTTFTACLPEQKENRHTEVPRWKDSDYKIPDDSLEFYSYKIDPFIAPDYLYHFNDITSFPPKWIALSKNKLGYFVYHRGADYNHYYAIGDSIGDSMWSRGYGENVGWPLKQFEVVQNNMYKFHLGDSTTGTFAIRTLEILDADTSYSIMETNVFTYDEGKRKHLGQYEVLVVPEFSLHLFPHIDEPNIKSPMSWIPLHKINIDSFRSVKE